MAERFGGELERLLRAQHETHVFELEEGSVAACERTWRWAVVLQVAPVVLAVSTMDLARLKRLGSICVRSAYMSFEIKWIQDETAANPWRLRHGKTV